LPAALRLVLPPFASKKLGEAMKKAAKWAVKLLLLRRLIPVTSPHNRRIGVYGSFRFVLNRGWRLVRSLKVLTISCTGVFREKTTSTGLVSLSWDRGISHLIVIGQIRLRAGNRLDSSD
jgi:hypothetical protein